MNDDAADGVSRRTVLRSSAVATGAVVAGGAVTGSAVGDLSSSSASSNKRGGRAQLDGTADRNRPFQLTLNGTDQRNATCMSGESATQTYLVYEIDYCDSNDDDSEGQLYVIPDEAELASDQVYVIRSIRPCRTNDLQKVAFGPSNESC